MLKKYEETAPVSGFLASMFQTPPENFHDNEKVTVDVVRSDSRVAVPLPQMGNSSLVGTRHVERTKYQNKEFTPPTYDTSVEITSFNSFKRAPGVDPFDPNAPMFKSLVLETMSSVRMVDEMTRRGVELQCAQVLTTGKIDLRDSTNTSMFVLDYVPKATHFATAGTSWTAAGAGDPEGDLSALGEVIRRDGKKNPTQAIFGRLAIQYLLANTKIRANLNLWNVNVGSIQPVAKKGNGAMFHGVIQLGTEMIELWSYKETYLDPITGNLLPYIPDNKVIFRAPDGRLDLTYGSIPTILPPDSRLANFMPSRLSDASTGLDVSINAYVSLNNKNLTVEVGTRALAIPTAIDTYGCLTVF